LPIDPLVEELARFAELRAAGEDSESISDNLTLAASG
jgi:hypothetical protein